MFNWLKERNQKCCYRLNVRLIPNWQALLGVKPEDQRDDYEEMYRELLNDGNIEYSRKCSLLGQHFDFVAFVDEKTGMRQIYSYANKSFVDNLEITGRLLECFYCENEEEIEKKYGYSSDSLTQEIQFSPSYLCLYKRDKILPWYQGVQEEDDYIARIPFYEIVKSFRKLFFKWGDPMARPVLKFPDELQKLLDKHKIKYLRRDFEDVFGENFSDLKKYEEGHMVEGFKLGGMGRMNWHTFDTEYLQVSINLKRLDGYDNDWDFNFSEDKE